MVKLCDPETPWVHPERFRSYNENTLHIMTSPGSRRAQGMSYGEILYTAPTTSKNFRNSSPIERPCRSMSNSFYMHAKTDETANHRPHAQAYHLCLGTWKRNATMGACHLPNLDEHVHQYVHVSRSCTFGQTETRRETVFFLSYLSS